MPNNAANVADSRGVVTLFGKVAHGSIHDPGSLAFRTRPGGHVTIAGGRYNTATNCAHSLTSSQGNFTE